MSLLIVLIPARARQAPGADAPPPDMEWAWAFSADGHTIASQGRGPVSAWPRATRSVAVLDDADVAWHRVTLPRAPAARMPQALLGVLEEQLLDDEAQLHFAVAPGAAAGQPAWVAVLQRPWLTAWLAAADRAGRTIDQVLACGAPAPADALARGHFGAAGGADAEALRLSWSDADGAAVLPLAGTLARARAAAAPAGTRWTATPAAAAAAEAWLGQPVAALGEAERALEALAAPGAPAGSWNFRQFTLAPRRRGTGALREAWRRLREPALRPVRWGLAALVGVQLVGLNAWAWQERQALQSRRQAMVALLQQTHPEVRTVLDAPRQMARQTEALRAAAGRPGEADLETLLGVAAGVWPPGLPPASAIRFERGRLTLGAPGWDAARVAAVREPLQSAGWAATYADGQLTLSRTPQEGR
jgi:general secretion pathway protein L